MALEYGKDYRCVYLRGGNLPEDWFFIKFTKATELTGTLSGRTGCGTVFATYKLERPSETYFDHTLMLTSVRVDSCSGHEHLIEQLTTQLKGSNGASYLKLGHPAGDLVFHNDEFKKEASEKSGTDAIMSMVFNLVRRQQ
ncbi:MULTISPECIES: hypothetical protein [Pseudomonas]|uniref:hypothetical protein n=1 Tax=Pseudomonas TaxID=286 RepID=UPI0018E68372|nr:MULTISPECIES: hypothetical protein [Pseudomonas]MBI6922259.1 hypothetical protein [Pseudomonas monteilii]MCE0940748.1 hypothetical protein [Pseudomonas kurunegalensis]